MVMFRVVVGIREIYGVDVDEMFRGIGIAYRALLLAWSGYAMMVQSGIAVHGSREMDLLLLHPMIASGQPFAPVVTLWLV
jgi:hypothetical protein